MGGKASGLARLLRLNLPVPAGFVLTELGDDIASAVAPLIDPAAAYAVRSSALDEDGAAHSFAGQYHTELGCRGLDAVVAGVRTCLASGRSAQVQAYAASVAPGAQVGVAVIVQRMVDAVRAGVLFTADPVTGRRDQWVLEVVEGLGDGLVSGAVQGERTLYDRQGRRLRGEGLADANERALLEGARRLALEVGGPVDIEFAIDAEGVLWFLQGRPVTALPAVHPNELDDVDASEGAVYTTANVSEMIPGPITPLTCSVFGYAVDQGMQDYMVRIGAQEAPVDAPRYIYPSYQHLFIRLDAVYVTARACVGASKRDVDLAVVGRPVPEAAVGPMQPLWRRLLNMLRLARYLWRVPSRVDLLERMAMDFELPDDGTLEGLYAELGAARAPLVEAYAHHYAASVSSGTWLGALTGTVAGRGQVPTTAHLGLVATLLSDIDGVESADAVTGLQRLGRRLATLPGADVFAQLEVAPARAWLESHAAHEIASFLERHGHRCIREAELRTRPWRDDPGAWVPMLQAMVGMPDDRSPVRVDLDEVVARLPRSARRALKFILPRARRGVVVREFTKSHLIRFQDHLKRGYRRLGERLVEAGRLPELDLVYFYTHAELAAVVRGEVTDHAQALSRRRLLESLWGYAFPVISVGPPVPLVQDDPPLPEGDLRGVPVSHGVVEGRVVVAVRLEDARRLRPGDILVAKTTDVGWSPWFAVAGGLVTEIGSPLSHGAVVAREFGIPAVVGVRGATGLPEGARVRVDGGAGTVTLLA